MRTIIGRFALLLLIVMASSTIHAHPRLHTHTHTDFTGMVVSGLAVTTGILVALYIAHRVKSNLA